MDDCSHAFNPKLWVWCHQSDSPIVGTRDTWANGGESIPDNDRASVQGRHKNIK